MDNFAKAVYDRATGISDTSAAYPLLLKMHAHRKINYMLFHFSMWLATNDVTNYRVVIPASGNPISERDTPHYILFNNKKDRTDFTKWLNRYKAWFKNEEIENNILPELPKYGSHTLHILSHNVAMYDFIGGQDSLSDEFIQLWTWVIKNCKKPVYVISNNSFAFTNSKEAVYFKLYWAEKSEQLNQ